LPEKNTCIPRARKRSASLNPFDVNKRERKRSYWVSKNFSSHSPSLKASEHTFSFEKKKIF
jgi:hypothetical protein